MDISWVWVNLGSKVNYFPLYGFSINSLADKIVIFGQYAELKEEVMSDEAVKRPSENSSGLLILSVENKELESKINDGRFKPAITDNSDRPCWECN